MQKVADLLQGHNDEVEEYCEDCQVVPVVNERYCPGCLNAILEDMYARS